MGSLLLEGKENGFDIENDEKKGIKLLKKAAEHGHKRAEEKLRDLADFTIKNDETNIEDINIARKLYQLMILMNVPNTEHNEVFIKVVEQMRDVGKLKETFNNYYSKLESKIKEQYSDIIKILQDSKDDKLVKYINLIALNFPKKKQ